jgi:peptidoglycan/LPS O-acetylase OafA/YrhL
MPNPTTYSPIIRDRTAGSPPTATSLLRRVRRLAGAYLAVSLASVAVLALHRYDHVAGGASVWTHGIIVAATALGSFSASILAGRGNHGAFTRLRVMSVVLVVAVTVIAALPGSFPLWMKLAEAIGAALMAAVAVTVNGPTLRAHFARG